MAFDLSSSAVSKSRERAESVLVGCGWDENESRKAVVEMHTAGAFQDEVLAYPAITAIRRTEKQGKVLVARVDGPSNFAGALPEAVRRVRSPENLDKAPRVASEATHVMIDDWFTGSDAWPCVSPERLALLKRLEAEFPPLEDPDTATKVGIGVATGADRVFLTRDPNLVEESRLLPLALAKDTIDGASDWSGHYLVNPWEADGILVDLESYPKLKRYFLEHQLLLGERHVSKKQPSRW